MSMRYASLESFAAMEEVATTVEAQNKIEANFTNYETWAKEIQSTGGSLKNIPVNHWTLGVQFSDNCNLMVKTITALNKLLDTVLRKKEALDFTKVTGIKEMEKVGIVAAPTILDPAKFRDNDWGTKQTVRSPIALKDKGWSATNAVGFAKSLYTALSHVGTYQAFNSSLKTMTDKLSKNSSTSAEDRKKLGAATRQVMHLYKVRHLVIVRTYNQFIMLKKTI